MLFSFQEPILAERLEATVPHLPNDGQDGMTPVRSFHRGHLVHYSPEKRKKSCEQ